MDTKQEKAMEGNEGIVVGAGRFPLTLALSPGRGDQTGKFLRVPSDERE
jgi:hypothetical protein